MMMQAKMRNCGCYEKQDIMIIFIGRQRKKRGSGSSKEGPRDRKLDRLAKWNKQTRTS
jgi:hypothetical protein